jgi:outer membrane protein insertion porin family
LIQIIEKSNLWCFSEPAKMSLRSVTSASLRRLQVNLKGVCRVKKWILIGLLFAVVNTSLFASEGGLLTNIELSGLDRTEAHVVERELLINEGENWHQDDLHESVQRLKNLRIFSDVQAQVEGDNDAPAVSLDFQEKWTTIPIFKFTSGGGTDYFVVGAYDINSFGRYIELGAQYENWNGEDAGVLWFRDPRFLDQRLRLGVDLWSVKRRRSLYNEQSEEVAQYVLDRRRINLNLDKEFRPWLKLGMGLTLEQDSFIAAQQIGDMPSLRLQQMQSPDSQTTRIARVQAALGRIDYDNYLVQGKLSELTIEKSLSVSDGDLDMTRVSLDNRLFWRLPYYANLGARFTVAATDSNALQHQYQIGGFENIRGFYDGQFVGRAYWQGNIEYRIPSLRRSWYVLQHNLFFDIAQIKDDVDKLSFQNSDRHYSAGIGLRFSSPKIYRFTGRLDYVLLTSESGSSAVSVGVQQFF